MKIAGEPDPYTVLGVDRTATAQEIRAAYHALAAQYHPDRHPGNPLAALAVEKLTEVNRAYEMLTKPARRPPPDADGGARRRTPLLRRTPRPIARAARAYRATAEAAAPRPPRRQPRRYGAIALLVILLPLIVRYGDAAAGAIRSFIVDLLQGLTLIEDSTVATVLATLVLALVVLFVLRRGARRQRATR